MVALSEFLDKGLYTVAEAAMYAGVHTQLATRWFYCGEPERGTIRHEVDDVSEKWVSFLDYIQLLAVRSIRQEKHVPLRAIRETITYAESRGITHPFARKHTIYILDPGKGDALLKSPRLLLRVSDQHGDDQWLDAAGRFQGHPNIAPIIESYLDDIGYDADGLAKRHVTLRDEGVEIEMLRGVAFGVPKIKGRRITVWDVWDIARSEGTIPLAAKALDLSETEVRVACRYVQSIKPAA